MSYSDFRKEMRINTYFGFKSWDSELASNYSSQESQNDEFTRITEPKRLSCSICLEEFRGKDMIIQLGCHPKHIFHEKCIFGWIKIEID